MPRILPWLLALLLAEAAVAETITVGPPGSGAQFTQVQPAVDAAQPHDTILVLPGSYPGPISVFVPLQIVGVGKPMLYATGPGLLALYIHGPFEAGHTAVLAGLRISGTSDPYWGSVEGLSISAPTVLMDCEVNQMQVGPTAVVMDGSSVFELAANGSQLWINDCEIRGWHLMSGGPYSFDLAGTPAAVLKGCRASISQTSIVGGAGIVGMKPVGAATGGDGLQVDGGTVVLRGGPGMLLMGGDGAHKESCGPPCGPPTDFTGGFALATANGASVVIQEDVPLAGGLDGLAGQHPALSDPSAVTMSPKIYPSLAVAGGLLDPGSTTTLFLAAEPGPALLGISPLGLAPGLLPDVDGALFVDLDTSRIFALVLPASGVLELPLALPLALTGIQLVAQLGTWGDDPTLSDPAILVVH
jgi:hypothetical protein